MNLEGYKFEAIFVEKVSPFVVNVQLNRPKKLNAVNPTMWREVGHCFSLLAVDPDVRVIILTGNGKAFSAGIDFFENVEMMAGPNKDDDIARRGREIYTSLKEWQKAFQMLEECPKPIIGAVHGLCLGAGVDLIAAADIRVACKNSTFAVKEVDVGLASDIGALNRLNKLCGNDSWVREVCMTARNFDETEALRQNLISRVYNTREEMMAECIKLAELIASKSPVAVQGTKVNLNFSRDHSVSDSMNFIAAWNMSQLMTEDIAKSAQALISKQPTPKYSKL